MANLTLEQLEKNPELLNNLVSYAKELYYKQGYVKERIFKLNLVKLRGLTKPCALKVMKVAGI